MHDPQKSDLAIVAGKLTNEPARAGAEPVEPRAGAKENGIKDSTPRTPSRTGVSHGLDRIRQAAKGRKKEKFTALLHHVGIAQLRAAYLALKRDAAPGVDAVTWGDYGEELERKLEDLHGRLHRGAYRAQPSRRKFIPKPDGRQRPLGIAGNGKNVLSVDKGMVRLAGLRSEAGNEIEQAGAVEHHARVDRARQQALAERTEGCEAMRRSASAA